MCLRHSIGYSIISFVASLTTPKTSPSYYHIIMYCTVTRVTSYHEKIISAHENHLYFLHNKNQIGVQMRALITIVVQDTRCKERFNSCWHNGGSRRDRSAHKGL